MGSEGRLEEVMTGDAQQFFPADRQSPAAEKHVGGAAGKAVNLGR